MYAGAVAVLIVGRPRLDAEHVGHADPGRPVLLRPGHLIQSLGFGRHFCIKLPVMMGVTLPRSARWSPWPTCKGPEGASGDLSARSSVRPHLDRHRAADEPPAALFPPVVTGTIIAIIGISPMRVGIGWPWVAPPAGPERGCARLVASGGRRVKAKVAESAASSFLLSAAGAWRSSCPA